MSFQDLRYGLYSLRRTPGFTVAAIVTLALGIGASTAIFSLLHAVVQRPPAVHAPGELFAVLAISPDEPDDTASNATSRIFSFPRFERLRAAAAPDAALAAMSRPTRVTRDP